MAWDGWVAKMKGNSTYVIQWGIIAVLSIFISVLAVLGMRLPESDRILVWSPGQAYAVLILILALILLIVLGMRRGYRLYAGLMLVLYAVVVFVDTIYFVTTLKPWLVASMVAATVVGTWMLGSAIIRRSDRKEIDRLREEGAGSDASETRGQWIALQTARADWLSLTCGMLIVLSLALYVFNHLQIVDENQPFRWQTHLTASQYLTQPGESLLAVAAALDVGVDRLASANPTIVVRTPITVASTSAPGLTIAPTGNEGRSLDSIARVLSITPEEVALGFATIEVVPDQVLRIPTSGPRLWIDWILWGLIGVSAYLLIEIARYFREIPTGKGDFINETPWYLTQLVTGPLIAFVALAILMRIDFAILGQGEDAALSVNLSQLPYDVIFGIAFLLGYFSRVARKLIGLITQSLFRSAWSAAADTFRIQIKGKPDEGRMEAGERVVFATEPEMTDIEWKVSEGELDGTAYRAPDVGGKSRSIVVTALASDGSRVKVSRTFEVIPHKYSIECHPDGVIRIDQPRTLEFVSNSTPLSEDEEKEIYWHWEHVPGDLKVKLDRSNGLTVAASLDPTSEPPQTEQEIGIVASFRGNAATRKLLVARRSLDRVTAQLADTTEPLAPDDSVAVGSQLTFTADCNLSESARPKIVWEEVGSKFLTMPAQATGHEISCEVKDDKAVGHQVTMRATLPDSSLEDAPSLRLNITAKG